MTVIMVHYKLTYFNGRGRGEIIRLVFAAANVPFEDVRLENEEFAKIKSSEKKYYCFQNLN